MPAIVAFFVRQLLIIGVQLGIFALIEKYVTPLFNQAIKALITTLGVDEEQAEDILANEILTTAESLGFTVALSKARLPLALAERLGFTSKGFSKRQLSGATTQKLAKIKLAGTIGTVTQIVPNATEANIVISAAKTTFKGAGKAFAWLEGRLAVTFLGFIAVNNLIDFGNWETGAYSNTFQKIFSVVTFGLLKPDEDFRKSKTTSPEVFQKVFDTYKIQGAVGINDPYKKQSVPFTRDNFLDLMDRTGADLLLTTGQASTKDTILATQLSIVFSGVSTPPASVSSAAPAAPVSQIKVFTGIVSQGVLGVAPSFIARPDDLIQNTEELRQAAENNLSSFTASIPGKIIYKISVVASVTTKDGFTQRGTAQQIISGYGKDGAPKYRTVVNKFAVADIFVVNDRGGNTKLARIVLGPTDAVNFRPDNNALGVLEQNLKKSLSANNITEIEQISTGSGQPFAVASIPQETPETVATIPYKKIENWHNDGSFFVDRERHYDQLYKRVGDAIWQYSPYTDIFTEKERQDLAQNSGKFDRIPGRLAELGVSVSTFSTVEFIADIIQEGLRKKNIQGGFNFNTFFGVTAPRESGASNQNLCSVTTLSKWYTAQGLALPSVSDRSKIYAELGLGQETYYTGTAEQNTKLLTEFLRKAGC